MDKEFLQKKIFRCTAVINELKGSQAWQIITEDFSGEVKRIDDSWHLIDDVKQLAELRVAKMASKQFLDVIASYEHDLNVAMEQLKVVNDPEAQAKINYGDK